VSDDARDLLPTPFHLDHRVEGDVHVLAVHGDLDIATCDRLSEAAEQVPAETRLLAVDLGGVTFLDSSGLRALLLCRRRADRDDIELVIGYDPAVHGPIFELTQLLDELPLLDAKALGERLGGAS
jgi:anti-anti-sigma factor